MGTVRTTQVDYSWAGFSPGDRSDPGHGDGDMTVGHHNRSAFVSLVYRNTCYLTLPNVEAFTVAGTCKSLVRALGQVSPVFRSTGLGIRGERYLTNSTSRKQQGHRFIFVTG